MLTESVTEDRWIVLAGKVIGLHPKDKISNRAIEGIHGYNREFYRWDHDYTGSVEIPLAEDITRALDTFRTARERPFLEHLDALACMPDKSLVVSSIKRWFNGSGLTGRDKRAIDLRFGLNSYDFDKGYGPMTLEQVGVFFGHTRERARQIIEIACVKLKIGLSLELDSAKPFIEALQRARV